MKSRHPTRRRLLEDHGIELTRRIATATAEIERLDASLSNLLAARGALITEKLAGAGPRHDPTAAIAGLEALLQLALGRFGPSSALLGALHSVERLNAALHAAASTNPSARTGSGSFDPDMHAYG